MLPNFVLGLHDQFDLTAWPRFAVRRNGNTWPDGTLYIRHDRPRHAAGFDAKGIKLWEGVGPGSDFDTVMMYVSGFRRHVSPLYICALQMHTNGV